METVRPRDMVGLGETGESSFIFLKSIYKMEGENADDNVSNTTYRALFKNVVTVVSIRF